MPGYLSIFSTKVIHENKDIQTRFVDSLYFFEEYCQRNAIKLVYIYIPFIETYYMSKWLNMTGETENDYNTGFYESLLLSHCKTKSIPILNPAFLIGTHVAKGEHLEFKYDTHMNEAGNLIVGEFIISKLKNNIDLSALIETPIP